MHWFFTSISAQCKHPEMYVREHKKDLSPSLTQKPKVFMDYSDWDYSMSLDKDRLFLFYANL